MVLALFDQGNQFKGEDRQDSPRLADRKTIRTTRLPKTVPIIEKIMICCNWSLPGNLISRKKLLVAEAQLKSTKKLTGRVTALAPDALLAKT
jgi:hypothetical protein